MNDAKQSSASGSTGGAKGKPAAQTWGITDADALAAWAGGVVELTLADGGQLAGHLVGYSTHWLTLKVGGLGVVLVSKGAIRTMRAA
jgi:hypothetical protein